MRYFFLIIFIVFSNYLYSQQEMMSGYRDDREISNLKGNIKNLISYKYKVIDYSFKIEKSDFIQSDLSLYLIFDKKSNIIEEGLYESDKKKLNFKQNKYKNNYLEKCIYYNKHYKITGFAFYKYNNQNKLINISYTDENKKEFQEVSYLYKNGNIAFEKFIDKSNGINELYKYEYDKNNNLIKQERDVSSNLKHKIIISYDNKNIVSKVEEIAGNKNLGFYYYYNTKNQLNKFNIKWLFDNTEMSEMIYYNENGDIIKISTLERDNKKTEITYKYKYDKNNNWIKRLEYKDGVCENIVIRTFTYHKKPK